MKIIEAMKKVKDLLRKADDLKKKVAKHHATLSIETPEYGTVEDQTEKVKGWIQAYTDILNEILKLKVAIQRTNLATKVTIELGKNTIERTIAEWIHRRRDLASSQASIWEVLNDKGLKDQAYRKSTGDGEMEEIKVVRHYDPNQRDEQIDLFKSEPGEIDGRLEVVNAVTMLMEV